MKKLMVVVSLMLLGMSPVLFAKEGKIVKGENGTKWCCPNGVKGDGCEKGANSTPAGARCNFASAMVPGPKANPTPKAHETPLQLERGGKAAIKDMSPPSK